MHIFSPFNEYIIKSWKKYYQGVVKFVTREVNTLHAFSLIHAHLHDGFSKKTFTSSNHKHDIKKEIYCIYSLSEAVKVVNGQGVHFV